MKEIYSALETATAIIRKERAKMDMVVETLIKKETIEKEEFIALVGESPKAPKFSPKPAVA